jgi:hypothetical protein
MAAQAETLATLHIVDDMGKRMTITAADYRLGLRPSGITVAMLFASLVIDEFDVGTTVVANPGSDPGFANFATELAADGTQPIYSLLCFPLCNGTGLSPLSDLTGATIEQVQVSFDDIVFDSPGSDPNGDGLWTDIHLVVTVVIEGQPLPSAAQTWGLVKALYR